MAAVGSGANGFVGRGRELAEIRSAAEAAAAGRPWVVWIEGAPGSGKTALVRQAVRDLPDGFTVVRAQADELATDIPYELAGQLGAANPEGPFAAGMDILDRWSHAQDQGPLAVLVEDLHWADAGSAQALLTAVKRLDEDRVLLLVTTRPEAGEAWVRVRMDPDRCRQVTLADFSVEEVAALAAASGVDLTLRQAARLHSHTQGHPIYVRTLLAELAPAQLRAPDGELPAPRSLASSITARLSELPAPARDLAAAMAVINQRSPLPTVAEVAGVPTPIEPFETLLGTGFVQWEPGEPGPPVGFAHPLFRHAIYQDLSPTRRRDLHRAVAGVMSPATALAHRVAAADGTDDNLANELEAAARQELDGGATGLGARNLLWASSLSRTSEDIQRRFHEAVRALLDSGQTARAAALRDQVEGSRDSAARSLLLGMIDWETGDATGAERWLRDAARKGESEGARRHSGWAWALLGEVYFIQSRAAEAIDAADRALALADGEPRIERLAWVGRALGEGMRHGAPAGLRLLHERLPQPADEIPAAEANLLMTRGTLGMYAGRTTAALRDHRTLLASRAQWSFPTIVARRHFQMATLQVNSGEWDEALLHARTALSVSSDYELVWLGAQSHSILATILANRGDWDLAERHLAQADVMATQRPTVEAAATARVAAAAFGRAQGRPDQVVDALGDLPAFAPMVGALTFWPTLIAALIEKGELDRAAVDTRRLEDAAGARGLEVAARLASIRGRLAVAQRRPDEAAQEFVTALSLLGPDDPFLDRALTHQAYGQLLKARGEHRQAVTQLRTAHQMLSSIGAAPFLARVDADLAATGIRSADRPGRSSLDLTDRERDVALLVAKGMTNPEVAAQLYISRKAVEYHLGNIYGKLGITSRRELRSATF